MKKLRLFATVLILLLSVQQDAFSKAKCPLDMSSPSVQYLQKVTDEGNIIRSNDIPVEKVDVTEDVARAKDLHTKFAIQESLDTKSRMKMFGKEIPDFDFMLPQQANSGND